jgi:uncharacterized protein (TIGR02598 family)
LQPSKSTMPMENYAHSGHSQPGPNRLRSGFSLIEVTLAIGIVAIAFVAVFGLIPAGLNSAQSSMNISIASQLATRFMGELQQTDFDQLLNQIQYNGKPDKVRWYTYDGTWSGSGDVTAIYWVQQRVLAPTLPPGPTSVSGTGMNLATVTIQVAFNPAQDKVTLKTGTGALQYLWTGETTASGSNKVIKIYTYSALVARNTK